jgi:phenylalanyl-tRNA synthetase beta chain
LERADLDGECVAVEIDLAALAGLAARIPQYRPIPQLPAVTRDLALLVPENVTAGALADAIRAAAGELCESVELFDLYRGKGLPEEHKSLAYRLVFRDPKAATDPERARTLTDAEVDAHTKAVIETVSSKLGATVRA